MKRVLSVALLFVAAGMVVLGAQRPPHFQRPPTCVYVLIRSDSLLVAAYAPPCDPSSRPPEDTVRVWRLLSQARYCEGHLLVDALGGSRVTWMNCADQPFIRRVDAPR